MATFTMAELNALVGVKDQRGRAGECSHPVIIPYNPPPLKMDVHRQIYNAIYHAGRAVTRRQIADALGKSKSSRLYSQLEHLVNNHYVVKSKQPYRGLGICYYEVAR